MKSTLLISLFISFQISLNYSFDYRLEYEIKDIDSDSIQLVNYYVNSKNNDYFADIRKNMKSGYKFYFRDQDKLTGQAIINGNYKNPGTVILNDSLTSNFSNMYDFKAKNYKIEKLKDTLINSKRFARVIFKLINPKKAKRKKIGSHIYIIDTTKVMKPLLTDPTILNIWRLNKNIPYGLIVEKQVYSSKGELTWTEKLKEVNPVNFNLLIK